MITKWPVRLSVRYARVQLSLCMLCSFMTFSSHIKIFSIKVLLLISMC